MSQSNCIKQKACPFTPFFKKIFKICSVIKGWYTGKHKYFFIFPSLFLLVYAIYFIFVFSFNFATFGDYNYLKYPVVSIAILIFIGLSIKVIYDLYKHNLTFAKILMAIFVLAITIRLAYMVYTPIYFNNGTWRQHDLGYGENTGHYGIIMYMFRNNFAIPDMIRNLDGTVNFEYSGQLYQPKLVHFFYALFMKFNSLFIHIGDSLAVFNNTSGQIDNITQTEYALFEMNRILACYISICTLVISYNILKELNISKNGRLIGFGLIAFSPIFYMFSTSLNNDSFSFFFGFLAILYSIKWYKNPTIKNIIFIAIFLGLGMSCKISIGSLSIFIAGVFLYKLIALCIKLHKEKKNVAIEQNVNVQEVAKEKKNGNNSLVYIICSFLIFAVFVFPIGLSYPIYAKIRFDQPLFYVWLIRDGNWNWINPSQISFFRRFIFPSRDFFKSFFVENHAWLSSSGTVDPRIQPNVWAYILKSSLFGEYSFNYGFSSVLYLIGFILNVTIVGLIIYLFYKLIKNKFVIKDVMNFGFIVILGITYYLSTIFFNIKYPFTCSMDFRYSVTLLLIGALIFGVSYDTLIAKNTKVSKVFSTGIIMLISAFSATSYLLYCIA